MASILRTSSLLRTTFSRKFPLSVFVNESCLFSLNTESECNKKFRKLFPTIWAMHVSSKYYHFILRTLLMILLIIINTLQTKNELHSLLRMRHFTFSKEFNFVRRWLFNERTNSSHLNSILSYCTFYIVCQFGCTAQCLL